MTSPQDRCPKPPPRAEWPVSRRSALDAPAALAVLAGSGLLGSAPTASAAETPRVTASPAKPEHSPR
ncbi:hypothetical protein ACFT38_34955 [Streptomyces sp. NPDC056975]|uniref:hypothetical protein n=1 Tax=Streptomyces sp. NPDC056975 TaxID=3345985 RepID=UPI003640916F